MAFTVSPRRLMISGAVLLAGSWLTLLFMVIGELPRHLLLSVGAYVGSVIGLFVGMVGIALHVRRGES